MATQTYQPGSDIDLSFPLVDDGGNPVVAKGLVVSILDENDQLVGAVTTVAIPAANAPLVVTVPAASNTLAAGASIGFRQVIVEVATATGSFEIIQGYVLRSRAQLTILQNTFQTYSQAQMRATMLNGLTNWPVADDTTRINALIDAYTRLTRFGYFVKWPRDPDAQNIITWYESSTETISPQLWPLMGLVRWNTFYPDTFRNAMFNAQIIEADYRISPSPIEAKRAAGVLSEKIGESQVTFRPGTALDVGLSKETLRTLTGFIDLRQTITRS